MSSLLQSEIDWINAHPERYEGPLHQKAVIANVVKRYKMNELKSKMSQWIKTKFVRDELILIEFFEQQFNSKR